ncbi:MAG: hypothetical protein WDN25_13535 [Acetobacteraceae bacterium]
MHKIDIADLDRNLVNDLGDALARAEAFEVPCEQATVGNQRYHVAFLSEEMRGGIVFVGSGSSGETVWTDAASAADVLARYLADDMTP